MMPRKEHDPFTRARSSSWTWVVPPASEADQKCFKIALFEMSGLAGSAPSMVSLGERVDAVISEAGWASPYGYVTALQANAADALAPG